MDVNSRTNIVFIALYGLKLFVLLQPWKRGNGRGIFERNARHCLTVPRVHDSVVALSGDSLSFIVPYVY